MIMKMYALFMHAVRCQIIVFCFQFQFEYPVARFPFFLLVTQAILFWEFLHLEAQTIIEVKRLLNGKQTYFFFDLPPQNGLHDFPLYICVSEKYELVGRLLKPGDEPTSYSDEEEDTQNESNASNKTTDEKPKEEWPKTLQQYAFYARENKNIIYVL